MRSITPRLTLRFHEYLTKSSVKRTQKRLARTQRRLQHLEKVRQHLLHRWSLLDSNLQQQIQQQEERQLPLPPNLRSLELFLEAREEHKALQQESLQVFQSTLGEESTEPMLRSLPSSILRPPSS